MGIQCGFQINATMVSNDFIDRYMAAANGEYVKVYLYILRHQGENINVRMVADALNHTESDVRRAMAYWEKLGAILNNQEEKEEPVKAETPKKEEKKERPSYSADQINRLSQDEDFSQLIYIAQKYLNKMFTGRECEVFAYLYDGLHMTAELLEYLVEYCVQSGHTSIRYIETVAINWHERKLNTVEKAKAYTAGFTRDSFAVMKAFGLSDRRPGDVEREMIDRWFREYGFTRDMVIEACNRTMASTHSPSFRYADKILSEWNKMGAKTLKDVGMLDEKRQKKPQTSGKKTAANQFHNFEERDTDYNSLVLEQVNSWIGDQ